MRVYALPVLPFFRPMLWEEVSLYSQRSRNDDMICWFSCFWLFVESNDDVYDCHLSYPSQYNQWLQSSLLYITGFDRGLVVEPTKGLRPSADC